MKTLWLPLVRNEHLGYMPDVPLDANGYPAVGFHANIPVEVRLGRPDSGHPIVQRCRVRFKKDEDAEKITNAGEPSDRDFAVIEALDVPRDGSGVFFDSAKAQERFRVIAQRVHDKTALRAALLEATRRGLRFEDARTIEAEHELELETTTRR